MSAEIDILIATLGGSPEAVKSAVDHYKPKKCFFVCTRETVVHLALAGYDGKRGDAQMVLESKDDVGKIIHDVMVQLREWFGPKIDIGNTNAIMDITGGTKAMSAALAVVAIQSGVNINYTGGEQRTKGGLGTVEGEPSYHVIPPFVPELEEARLWDQLRLYAWESASDRVEHILKSLSLSRFSDAEALKRKFEALKFLILGCRAWDHFEHHYAKDYFERSKNRFLELKFSHGECRSIMENIEKTMQFLGRTGVGAGEQSNDKKPTPYRCADLYFNAARRFNIGKYDDAALRLYRCIEMTSQYHLNAREIDSSNVRLEQIPHEYKDEYTKRFSNSRKEGLEISLNGQLRLLEKIDPQCGIVSWIRDNKKGFADVQTARNYSILAHGFDPIGKSACQKFLGSVETLMKTIIKMEPFQDPLNQLLNWR